MAITTLGGQSIFVTAVLPKPRARIGPIHPFIVAETVIGWRGRQSVQGYAGSLPRGTLRNEHLVDDQADVLCNSIGCTAPSRLIHDAGATLRNLRCRGEQECATRSGNQKKGAKRAHWDHLFPKCT